MNELTEATAENLRFIRGSRAMNQRDVADLLGIEKYGISRIELGKRSLTATEKQILDWHFFGKLPKRINGDQDPTGASPSPACSLVAKNLLFPICREEGEIVVGGNPDDRTKWIPHAQFLQVLEEIKRAAECVGGADIIQFEIARYLANTQ